MILAFHIAAAGLILSAAIGDARTYRIPNALPLALIGLFAAYLAVTALWSTPPDDLILRLSLAAGGFVVLAGLFGVGMIGGGDAKLIPPVMLWLEPNGLPAFVLIMALSGGALSTIQMIRKGLDEKNKPDKIGIATNLNKVPYGIAIATGSLFVICQQIFKNFLAG